MNKFESSGITFIHWQVKYNDMWAACIFLIDISEKLVSEVHTCVNFLAVP